MGQRNKVRKVCMRSECLPRPQDGAFLPQNTPFQLLLKNDSTSVLLLRVGLGQRGLVWAGGDLILPPVKIRSSRFSCIHRLWALCSLGAWARLYLCVFYGAGTSHSGW